MLGATVHPLLPEPIKLTWDTQDPIWVEQWPLPQEKIAALKELVQEQLTAGHIEPSLSPHNTPVFVIQKKDKKKWRFL